MNQMVVSSMTLSQPCNYVGGLSRDRIIPCCHSWISCPRYGRSDSPKIGSVLLFSRVRRKGGFVTQLQTVGSAYQAAMHRYHTVVRNLSKRCDTSTRRTRAGIQRWSRGCDASARRGRLSPRIKGRIANQRSPESLVISA